MKQNNEREIGFTLIVRPHKAWSRIYHIYCEENKVHYSSASGKDYPNGISMDFVLKEEVEYEEKSISEEDFSELLNLWNEISSASIDEVLSLNTGSGLGGSICSLQVTKEEMTVTFDWYQLHGRLTLFESLIDFIRKL